MLALLILGGLLLRAVVCAGLPGQDPEEAGPTYPSPRGPGVSQVQDVCRADLLTLAFFKDKTRISPSQTAAPGRLTLDFLRLLASPRSPRQVSRAGLPYLFAAVSAVVFAYVQGLDRVRRARLLRSNLP